MDLPAEHKRNIIIVFSISMRIYFTLFPRSRSLLLCGILFDFLMSMNNE